MLCITHLTHGGLAIHEKHPHLSRGKLDLGVPSFFGHQLAEAAGTANQLAAFARVQLQIMDLGTEGHVSKGQHIARLDVSRAA
jgi:hypothetical protein